MQIKCLYPDGTLAGIFRIPEWTVTGPDGQTLGTFSRIGTFHIEGESDPSTICSYRTGTVMSRLTSHVCGYMTSEGTLKNINLDTIGSIVLGDDTIFPDAHLNLNSNGDTVVLRNNIVVAFVHENGTIYNQKGHALGSLVENFSIMWFGAPAVYLLTKL